MKKRVLSFLMACFMVVSTFIISKPLVHVHAVEGEQTFVEGENQWTLPTDWSHGKVETYMGWDIPKQGNWQLGGYSSLDSAIPVTNPNTVQRPAIGSAWTQATMPWPYLATLDNEKVTQKKDSVTGYGPTGWYVNYDYRWNGVAFRPLTDASGLSVVAHKGQNNVITFTAPSSGVYSYTELVTQVLFETAKSKEKVTFTATVRKNGAILDTFSLSEEATSATLDGEVALNKGDLLMFAFVQNTAIKFNNTTIHTDNDPNCLKVTDLVVKKVSDVIPEEEVKSWSLPMNWNTGLKSENDDGALYSNDKGWDYAQKKDEPWKFAFYTNVDTAESYVAESKKTTAEAGNISGVGVGPSPFIESTQNRWALECGTGWTSWYVCSTGRWQATSIGWGDNSTFMQFSHKNKDYTPAVVFIAPEDGLYSFSELVTGWVFEYSGKAISSLATVRKNGKVLASFVPTAENATKTVTGTVELKAGEELAFVFSQTSEDFVALPDANNRTTYQFKLGTTEVTKIGELSEVEHVAEDSWTYDAEGHWHACATACDTKFDYAEHDWTNEDGVCAICEFECTHDWSNKDGVCANCGMTHNHIDSSIVTTCNNDGTHTDYCEECGYVYGSENCKPMDGYFCKCGYDCTVDVLTENATNMIKDYFANGNTITGTDYITAVGPTTALGDEYKATQSAPVDGVTYVLFNLVFDEEGNAYLRHHFYITDDAAIITLNGEDVELKHDDKCSEGIYYFDQALVVGTLADAAEIAIGTQLANETIEVSFYSYIKIALENGVSADQETILRALYDLNEAAK